MWAAIDGSLSTRLLIKRNQPAPRAKGQAATRHTPVETQHRFGISPPEIGTVRGPGLYRIRWINLD